MEQGQVQILHIDDEPEFTDLTATFLERQDDRFAVETATSAKAGLDSIRNSQPDCVVSDYNMPGMDGLELLQAVRDDYPTLPFILFTGQGSESIASDAIAAGVTDYLQKGTGSERYELLANRIRNAVEGRREAQRANRQEQLMRLTEFAGNTGGFEYDRATNTILLTAGSRRIIDSPETFEMSLEEAMDQFHPDDREQIQQTLQEAIETGADVSDLWRLQSVEGGERFIDITISPVVENGEVTKLRGAGNDITEYRQRETELKQYETILSNIRETVIVTDSDGQFTYISPNIDRVFGYDVEELEEFETVETLFGERLVEPDRLAANGEVTNIETTITDNSGERSTVLVTVREVDIRDGARLYSIRDITDRRVRQRELEKTTNQLETVLETAGPAFLKRADGQYQVMNTAAKKLLGLDPNKDITGLTDYDLFPDDVAEQFRADDQRVIDAGEPITVEEEVPTAEGTRIYQTNKRPLFDTDGNVETICAVATEITDRKEQEQKLTEQKQRLQRQNERLDEFVSVVSHDLRNPLGVASGRLELIRQECESPHIDDAARALDRMAELIDDLLVLAREDDTIDKIESVVLSEIAQSSWQTTETRDATLDVDIAKEIAADRSQLQQLFENLYRNAVEHGGEDVTVTVGAMDDGFYVADTGSGIAESDREQVFEAGYSTSDKGTGFGLRIVEQIADTHGWMVTVAESTQGGARFEFTGCQT